MTLTDIAALRLLNQQVATTKIKTAKKLLSFMGAMQAQDYTMATLAIGVRLPGATNQSVERSINKGEIIRTHAIRATWHFVASEDIYWMLDLSANQIKQKLKATHIQLGLSEKDFSSSSRMMTKMLEGGNHITREEIITQLEKAKIATNDNRSSHILLRAELDGIICRSKIKGNKHSYASLEEWVPERKIITREEALEKLARKYFTSHNPATLQDFVWWSALTVKDARHALDMIKQDFIAETIQSKTYWLTNVIAPLHNAGTSLFLLPAFDEFIIGYTDRTAALSVQHFRKAISNNGIFWPVIVINGQVAGVWKRTMKNERLVIEASYFKTVSTTTRNLVEQTAGAIGYFWDKEVTVLHHQK